MKTLITIVFLLVGLLAPVHAWQLDGKTVILVVSKHRQGDKEMNALREKVKAARQSLGHDKKTMPLIFMGFADSDTDRTHFDRLGFQSADSPVLAVVEWGNPARFGPKRIIGRGIVRKASPNHVSYIMKSFQDSIDAPDKPITKPLPLAEILDVVSVRFKVRGKPLYHSSAGIRLRNTKNLVMKDITIRYLAKLPEQKEWQLLEKRQIDTLPPGNFVSRDIVFDARKTALLSHNKKHQACLYRFEVRYKDELLVEEGAFQ